MISSGAYISSIEFALPERLVTNADLERLHPDWSMDQVAARTGVEQRYWCAADETALDLAETACRRLFSRASVGVSEIDAILFCTQSPDYVMPPNATLLQARLGLKTSVAALDFSLACSGFVYGLYLAKGLIKSGLARHVLLVTGDAYSRLFSLEDRGPATLFGDGAAATLLSAGTDCIGEFVLRTDGSRALSFMVPAGGARIPRSATTAAVKSDAFGARRSDEHIVMNGAAVLDFVKTDVIANVKELLDLAHLTTDGVDLFVFHQASRLALDFLHEALHIPSSKQFVNLASLGNTVSASLPIALSQAERAGRLTPGMKVVIAGFGVGLSWGSCLVTWGS